MAYYDISLLANDADFSQRTQACVATEAPNSATMTPAGWWSEHAWDMASQPGFGDAYASAIANEVPNPGRDPSVISDAQILSAVQAIAAQPAPETG